MYHVVFVDDETDLCELYPELYSSSNIRVTCFSDPVKARAFIENEPVSLVFIDYRMPTMNGVELRKQLSAKTPCFLLTGEFVDKKIEGFEGVVQKPMDESLFDLLLKDHAIPISISSSLSSADPYRTLMKHLKQEIHIWKIEKDGKGKIKTWRLADANPAALKAWGKTLEEIVSKSPEEIFPQSDAIEAFMPIVEKIFAENQPLQWNREFKGTGQMLKMTSIPCGDYFISVSEIS